MSQVKDAQERRSSLPVPEDAQALIGYIRGTLIALEGVRKQKNDAIRPDLLLVARIRLDALMDTLFDCETRIRESLDVMRSVLEELEAVGDSTTTDEAWPRWQAARMKLKEALGV